MKIVLPLIGKDELGKSSQISIWVFFAAQISFDLVRIQIEAGFDFLASSFTISGSCGGKSGKKGRRGHETSTIFEVEHVKNQSLPHSLDF